MTAMDPRGLHLRVPRLALVIVAGLGTLALAPTAAAHPRRPAIRVHGHRFVPVTGDWEGTADGYPASFELSYAPFYSIPYGLNDLVRMAPTSCPAAVLPPASPVIDGGGLAALDPGGSLGAGQYNVHGGLTGARTATLWSKITYAGTGSASCVHRLTFRMHPARRTKVDDGTWAVGYTGAGAQKLSVTAGGRLASPLAVPPSTDVCYPNYLAPPAELGDSMQLFIGPSGLATSQFGYWGITATVRFGRATLSGQLAINNQTCHDSTFPLTGSLTKHAR
jgi:hypothetical protein